MSGEGEDSCCRAARFHIIADKMIRLALVSILFIATAMPALFGQSTQLSWSPASVSWVVGAGSTTPVTAKVLLVNTGTAQSTFTLSQAAEWLTVSPTAGTIPAGSNVEITLTANPAGLPTGMASTAIIALSGGQSGASFLPVNLDISGYSLQVRPTSLTFDPVKDGAQSKPIEIRYSDDEARAVTWSATTFSGGNWLTLSATPPVLAPLELAVTADATNMQPGDTHMGEIRLSSPTVASLETVIPVKMTVFAGETVLTVVPDELHFYVYGTESPAPQPVQVVDFKNRDIQFNVLVDPPNTPLTVPVTTAATPRAFQVGIDTSRTIELPRRDRLTFQPTSSDRETVMTVHTNLEPRRVNAIPQVADGGPFRTEITVANLDSVPAVVTLRFFKSQGESGVTTPWDLAMEGNARIQSVVIPVGASYTVRTAGATAEVNQGWGEVVSVNKIGGTAVFEFMQLDGRTQEAAVPISNTLMQRLLLPFDNTSGFVTSVAVINKHDSESARVTGVFRDPQGRIFKVAAFPTLPALGHRAFELSKLFPEVAGRRGTLDLNASSGNIAMLGLRFNSTGAFTSFEAHTLNRRRLGVQQSIPQIVDGMDFTSEITLINHTANVAHVKLKFYRETSNGATEPWNLLLEGRSASDPVDIPVGSAVTIRTAGLSAGTQSGWAAVESDAWVSGMAVYRQRVSGRPDQEATVPVNIGSPARQLIPFDNTGQFTTSIAVANQSATAPGNFILTAVNQAGQRIAQAPIPTLPPLGHRAFRLKDLSPLLDGQRGTIELSVADGEISALGLRFLNSGAFTSISANLPQ